MSFCCGTGTQLILYMYHWQKGRYADIMLKYESLIKQMTLMEKASMMSGKDFWQTLDIERLGIPSMRMSDGPHGIRKQAGENDHLGLNASIPATCFPTAATISNSWDIQLAEQVGQCLGEEALAQGVDVLLGPGLNIKRSPLCGRNFEYFSEDPYLSGKMAAGYVRGIQSKGVAACPKHFAVNSQETQRMSSDSVLDERTFREIYTTGFEIAVKEGKAKSIMSSYNKINGVYANENKHLLQDILVKEWGFDGFVVSDWGASNDHVKGVEAGSHLEMPTTGADGCKLIMEAVRNGTLKESILDERVDKLLEIVFDVAGKKEKVSSKFDIKGHHKVAQKAAEESIVLLKNEDSILPLSNKENVAIIGDFAKNMRYQGAGSSIVNPTKLDNILKGIEKQELAVVGYEEGFVRTGQRDEAMKEAAVELAKKANIVLMFMGLDELAETEGQDRAHMKMAKNQCEVLEAVSKVNSNVVVILSAGSPVEMHWMKNAKAVLHGYLAGQAGAGAILRVLTGKVCPSGKLSETYPIKYEDTPAFHYWPGKQKNAQYREGIYVGYRYYESVNMPVCFPFGYGLSYTIFEYSKLEVTEKEVSLTVKNTGKTDGAEIVQMYIGAVNSPIYGPAKELKGFAKVFLKAGESKKVIIPLDDKAFRYYNVKTNSWEIEGGVYSIMVGANVKDIRLTGQIAVAGTNAPIPYDKEKLPSYYKFDIVNVSDEEFGILLGKIAPKADWDMDKPLDINDAVCQMYYAKTGLARLVYKILTHIKETSKKKGKPNLNVFFIYSIPFRGIAKMTGGAVSMDMAKAMQTMVNGHFFKGLGCLIKGYFRNNKNLKKWKKQLIRKDG